MMSLLTHVLVLRNNREPAFACARVNPEWFTTGAIAVESAFISFLVNGLQDDARQRQLPRHHRDGSAAAFALLVLHCRDCRKEATR